MLEIRGLRAGYGPNQVLFGIDLTVGRGQVVSLLGRNGMGKTTTVRSIMGLLPVSAGEIHFDGRIIKGARSYEIARAGIGLVPEGRRIFPNLTVRENLEATFANRLRVPRPWDLERVIDLFPRLGERLDNYGNQLSGGEQQMLAIGRALMTNPKLLVLDEATEGLAPLIRDEVWRCLEELKQLGQAILVIDKNVQHLMRIADHHYVIEKGGIVWHGDSEQLRGNTALQQEYLGV